MEWWQWLLLIAGLGLLILAGLVAWTFYVLTPRTRYNEEEERQLAEEYLAQTRYE